MNQIRMIRKSLFISLVVLLALLIAGPVLAGGWAVVTLDKLPGEIHAGENVHLGFMVRQHGQEPVHFLYGSDSPIVPVVSGFNVKTGESIQFTAVPDQSEVGHFYADVVFPSEGEWSWEIAPNPLAGTTELPNLTILPGSALPTASQNTATVSTSVETAVSTTPTANTPDLSLILRSAAVLLFAGGAVTAFMASRRKDEAAVVVQTGD